MAPRNPHHLLALLAALVAGALAPTAARSVLARDGGWRGVREWHGTIAYEVTIAEHRRGEDSEVAFDIRRRSTTRLHFREPSVSEDGASWNGFGAGDGRVDETVTATHRSRDGSSVTFRFEAHGGGGNKLGEGTPASLDLDLGAGTYSVGVSGPTIDVTTTTTVVGAPIPPTTETSERVLEYGGLDDLPLPREVGVLSGRKKVPTYVAGPTPIPVEGVLTWTLKPGPEEDLELVVAPLGYETWIPEGNRDQDQPGNDISVRARLQTKDGKAPQEKAKRIRFELASVSTEPGTCLNHPAKGTADRAPDLRFVQARNLNGLAVSTDGKSARTGDGAHVEVTGVVSAFDHGAWGDLKVVATLADGRELVGHLEGAPSRTEVALPKRTGGSRVADAWKQSTGVAGLPDDDDEEDVPQGDPALGAHKGDGLTLYEEYRGFFQSHGTPRHLRGDPKKKEFFILDEVRGPAKVGIDVLRAETGLEVHDDLEPGDVDTNERIVNFNHDAAPRRGDKFAVELTQTPQQLGYAYAEGIRDPDSWEAGWPRRVVISGDFVPDPQRWATVRAGSFTNEYVKCVAHELLHTCSVLHHGDDDRKVDWWVIVDPATGRNVTLEGPAGSAGQPTGQPVTIKLESGPVRDLAALPNRRLRNVRLGVPHGQHSGFEDCLMRYFIATAFEFPQEAGVRWHLGRDAELLGIHVCDRLDGVDVNGPGHSPHPRYQEAAPGRGRCKRRICVNDAIPHR